MTLLVTLLLCATQDSADQIRALIEKLQSEKIEERVSAIEGLCKFREAALPKLESLEKSGDPETSGRARQAIERIKSQQGEDVLDRMEKTLREATSIRCESKAKFLIQIDSKEKIDVETTATLLLKGKRLHATLQGLQGLQGGAAPSRKTVSSDGQWFRGSGASSPSPCPTHFQSNLATLIVRSGPHSLGDGGPARTEEALRKELRVSKVRRNARDELGESITYTLQSPDPEGMECEFTLWYDPTTFVPIKRTLKAAGSVRLLGAVELTGTETYSKFILNGEIADDELKPTAER